MQQVAIHLWLDQHQVNEHDDEVVLDIFVAEPAAVLAHGQPDIVARGLVARAFAPERLDGVPAFDADRHCLRIGRAWLSGYHVLLDCAVAVGNAPR